MKRFITFLISIAVLTGCAIGPDYKRPAIDTPASWRFEEKETRDVANTTWWEQFNDPVLNDLIQISLSENKDLKIASARIESYIGQYWVARAGLFPQIAAGGSAGKSRISELGSTPLSSQTENPAWAYQASLNSMTGSWEIDVWGRLRRATEAARADLLSSEEGRRAVILSLVSFVANAYINLRDLDKQLEVAERTVQSREDSYKLFTLRYKGGIISLLELSQVESEYEQTLSQIPVIKKNIAQQENSLSVLLGRNPSPIPRGKTIDELMLPPVPEGLPSDLLERRPDIRQAEQALVAANARIGVARALYFPTITLTGLFGWSSTELTSLFNGPAQIWSWAGNFSAPVFTGGANVGQNIVAEAQHQEVLLRYQKTIQTAFREVEDALVDQKRIREQLDAQKRQVEALRTSARVARLRYDNGYVSYIEVLDAERSLFNAELDYARTQGALFQAFVSLYASMGGGWVTEADKMTAAVTPAKLN
ncbi:MAG: efflux transporter outer membrane subunit [Proteobacteria bacterium]|nr:efflux transporter outer membrane subunit [Pseudomonadota bacterium]